MEKFKTDFLNFINIYKYKLLILLAGITLFFLMAIVFTGLLIVPTNYPLNSIYTVKSGSGLTSTANDLKDKHIINSTIWFKVMAVLYGGTKGLKSGDYVLDQKQSVTGLALRLTSGDYHLLPIKVTFPEGLNVYEISKVVSKNFPKINESAFTNLIRGDEGYLFPDTYMFLPNTEPEDIISELKDNFQRKIITLDLEIKKFNKPISDVVKMASIVEEEARTQESRRVVAGILWNRISKGMPLQVDASFKYINGKTTYDLTLDDLKIDNPYNSYIYKGLPPTPISNPGLDSILATITPIKTDYLFFLTDNKGNMHYAKTFDEHVVNKQKYLP